MPRPVLFALVALMLGAVPASTSAFSCEDSSVEGATNCAPVRSPARRVPLGPVALGEMKNMPNYAFVSISLIISPTGQVTNCTVLDSSGHDPINREYCRLAAWARYEPALDLNGNAVEYRMLERVTFTRAPWAEFMTRPAGE